jgi:hypothetical protein
VARSRTGVTESFINGWRALRMVAIAETGTIVLDGGPDILSYVARARINRAARPDRWFGLIGVESRPCDTTASSGSCWAGCS